MLSLAFILEKTKMIAPYKTWFLFDQFLPLNHYIRYIMIQFTLGGLAGRKTVEEILFGHKVETLNLLS
jgi:hypothetical protein